MKSLYIFAFSLVHLGAAYSASFDCDLAKGFVEKRICSDKELSALDSKYFKAYQKAIEEADQPAEVKSSAKQWLLKTRNTCTNSACLKKAYDLRIQELEAVKKFTWALHQDTRLGIEFSYPSNRTVRTRHKEKIIEILGFSMPGSDYIIQFELGKGNLKRAIKDSSIFEKIDGKWVSVVGPFLNTEAEKISGADWRGMKSTVTCAIFDEGMHGAGGACLWALLSNGKKYVVASTQGRVGTDEHTLKTLMSIKFIE